MSAYIGNGVVIMPIWTWLLIIGLQTALAACLLNVLRLMYGADRPPREAADGPRPIRPNPTRPSERGESRIREGQ